MSESSSTLFSSPSSMAETSLRLSMDDLLTTYSEYKHSYSKPLAIGRSITSWISILSASTLIWMLCRSHVGLSSTFHRLLLGLCLSHELQAFSMAHFNLLAPKDSQYMVWNARGDMHTCTIIGFLDRIGSYGILLYSCCLNIYYMMVVTFNKSDEFIRMWVEPWLHGIPVFISIGSAILSVSGDNFNDDTLGQCWVYRYEPPHCIGYESGTIREGFHIPCGRGESGGIKLQEVILAIALIAPIVIFVSLFIIYVSLRRLESNVVQHAGESSNMGDGNEYDELLSSIENRKMSLSWGVMNRVFAYSAAYFLCWGWFIFGCLAYTIRPGNDLNDPSPWPRWLVVTNAIILPLQSFFDFIIYLHPKVVHAKRTNNNLFQAIIVAIWSRGPCGSEMDVGSADGQIQDDDIVLDSELELEAGNDTTSPSLRSEIQQDGILMDAEVELASAGGASTSTTEQQNESSPPNLQQNRQSPLHQEESSAQEQEQEPSPALQCSIPFAQVVSSVGVENDEEESGGQSADNEDAMGPSVDVSTSSLQDINPSLLTLMESHGIAVATLEQHINEPDESREDDLKTSDLEHFHQVALRMSDVGLIPEPPLLRNYSHGSREN